ncbi:hypothetical protein AGDE_01363 [Angomonas deanei]|uniref:Uncharacterized protein n=1 Tax=Angomonas deanei TaxID=59799 RepID=A0A7G2CFV1_9TRYP|nr:hypothetical protein AGDE_01363 [Angomonas deanei]CAD2218666.1 hypothetical protein, conserved [Angomonas deanei]|eukprot:EPY42560.1 hypothetical protein AGDE_01363 [Angomonas deanei]
MSGASALRKLLFAQDEEGEVNRRGYHFSGTYEENLFSCRLDHPGVVQPRSALSVTSTCLAACFVGCLTMKTRNKEKWWFGLFLLCGVYYNALKAHKVGNGLVGHQGGFFAAGMGAIGCACRVLVRSGSRRNNLLLFSVFTSLMWYEVGRFHLWSEHVSEYKREVFPERSHDLLSEYVPDTMVVEFLPYRSIS